MKTIAVVPTRGGSKGLPGKNMERVGRETLIEIALRQGSRTCDHVVLVTDSLEHFDHAVELGFEAILYPNEVADDELPEVKTRWAIRTFPEVFAPYDTIVRLFATQPLRSDDDIARAIRRYRETMLTTIGVSVAPFREHQVLSASCKRSVVYPQEGAARTRQEVHGPDAYINGTVYVTSIDSFTLHAFWDTPMAAVYVHRLRAIDVDDHEDLRAVRILWPVRSRLWALRP